MWSVQASANRWWPWWWFDMKEKAFKGNPALYEIEMPIYIDNLSFFSFTPHAHQETINMFHCWLDSVGSSLKASTQSVKIVFFSLECSLLPPPSKQRQQSGFSIEKRRFATQHEGEREKLLSLLLLRWKLLGRWKMITWKLYDAFSSSSRVFMQQQNFLTVRQLDPVSASAIPLHDLLATIGGDFVWCLGWRCRENRLSANLKKNFFIWKSWLRSRRGVVSSA